MKIDVFVLCKNEMKLAPFFIDYWQALAEDVNVYVFDGLSTDGCRELFAQYDWIHVIDFEPDALDDIDHAKLKNECWKDISRKNGADFVMVCDFDETIFSYDVETLHEELRIMKENGFSILAPLSFNLIPDRFPKYKKGKFLHELAKYGFNDYVWEAKPILFDPNKIEELNTVCGGHCAHPVGEVKWYLSTKLFLIHAKYLGLDFYTERIRNRVITDRNRKYNMNGETDKTLEDMKNSFKSKKARRFKWTDIPEHFDEYYKIKIDWRQWNGLYIGPPDKGNKDKYVVITMTSWPKRIHNVSTVIMSLLNQTIEPDLIELNLSLDEFPNREEDLPAELVALIKLYKKIQINWVIGNFGVFKKVIPTLKKFYGDDYYLFSVDDDWIYQYDYIDTMLSYLKNSGADSFCLAEHPLIGHRVVYQSKIFDSDYWEELTQEVVDTRIDDYWTENYLRCKGYKLAYLQPNNVFDLTRPFNPVFPNSGSSSNEYEGQEYSQEWIEQSYKTIEKYRFKRKDGKD